MATTIKRRYDELSIRVKRCKFCVSHGGEDNAKLCSNCGKYKNMTQDGDVVALLDHIKALEDTYFGAPEGQPAALPPATSPEERSCVDTAKEILTYHLQTLDEKAFVSTVYARDGGVVFFIKVSDGPTNHQCQFFAKTTERVLLRSIPALAFVQITFM